MSYCKCEAVVGTQISRTGVTATMTGSRDKLNQLNPKNVTEWVQLVSQLRHFNWMYAPGRKWPNLFWMDLRLKIGHTVAEQCFMFQSSEISKGLIETWMQDTANKQTNKKLHQFQISKPLHSARPQTQSQFVVGYSVLTYATARSAWIRSDCFY